MRSWWLGGSRRSSTDRGVADQKPSGAGRGGRASRMIAAAEGEGRTLEHVSTWRSRRAIRFKLPQTSDARGLGQAQECRDWARDAAPSRAGLLRDRPPATPHSLGPGLQLRIDPRQAAGSSVPSLGLRKCLHDCSMVGRGRSGAEAQGRVASRQGAQWPETVGTGDTRGFGRWEFELVLSSASEGRPQGVKDSRQLTGDRLVGIDGFSAGLLPVGGGGQLARIYGHERSIRLAIDDSVAQNGADDCSAAEAAMGAAPRERRRISISGLQSGSLGEIAPASLSPLLQFVEQIDLGREGPASHSASLGCCRAAAQPARISGR